MSGSLTIEGITKSYGDKAVLNQVSFSAARGEFLVLVGPSGCGKSTMLRAIAGLESVGAGKIKIDDREVTHLAPKDRDIAMVFQDYALYPHKNVYENIAFGLRIRKFPEEKIDVLVQRAAKKLDLLPLLKRKPGALSGGQRQRVAIGRAIVRDPKVFLFDEPLSNLDAKLRGSMRITISKLHKELEATVVYVTHDQIEAMTLADRIIVLNGGHIQQIGAPLDLYYHPTNIFVATFIGSPPMNMLDGKIVSVGDHLRFRSELGLEYPLPDSFRAKLQPHVGKDVIWGVRAENFKPFKEGRDVMVTYDAKTVVTEILGPTSAVLCDIQGHEIHVSLPAPMRPVRDEMLKLSLQSKHLYLFDKATGDSLVE